VLTRKKRGFGSPVKHWFGRELRSMVDERLHDSLAVSDGYLGPDGRTALLGRRIEKRFEALAGRLPNAVGPRTGIGAMQAFVPWNGAPEIANAVLKACFEEGLILLNTGSLPMRIRMLPPVNTTDEELEAAFGVLEKALLRVAEERELPC